MTGTKNVINRGKIRGPAESAVYFLLRKQRKKEGKKEVIHMKNVSLTIGISSEIRG